MANSYSTMPIIIDTTFTDGWKAHQTLYGSAADAVGIRPVKVLWTARTASQANNFSIQDPASSIVLLQGQSIDGANPADIPYDFEDMGEGWHDFKVPTLTSGKLLIWYRV